MQPLPSWNLATPDLVTAAGMGGMGSVYLIPAASDGTASFMLDMRYYEGGDLNFKAGTVENGATDYTFADQSSVSPPERAVQP